jgi:hypothetical protein
VGIPLRTQLQKIVRGWPELRRAVAERRGDPHGWTSLCSRDWARAIGMDAEVRGKDAGKYFRGELHLSGAVSVRI